MFFQNHKEIEPLQVFEQSFFKGWLKSHYYFSNIIIVFHNTVFYFLFLHLNILKESVLDYSVSDDFSLYSSLIRFGDVY